MRPSDMKFMMTYMKPKEQSERSARSRDNFDIEQRQVPFKSFKKYGKEKEYSAKKQKDSLYRILPPEEIDNRELIERINESNVHNGYDFLI